MDATNPVYSFVAERQPGNSRLSQYMDGIDCITKPVLRTMFALIAVLATAADSRVGAASSEADEFFEKQVRPILVERCQGCHGAKKQWAGLRLDSAASLQKGGDSGPALVAGKPADSELIHRVTHEDVELRMPPEDAGAPLTPEQIQVFSHWIEIGAPWPESVAQAADATNDAQRRHWAFQPVERIAPPPVKDQTWPRNPIDQFILAKLEAKRLRPSPAADRRTLIRRATYDLIGLPPTADEVSAFVCDDSPDAYERLVDRLLASPCYGEQWGRTWLDIARFSDTKGYVYDRESRFFVHSALYRDWVIKAFNDDLPYDRFVLLQLAADQVAPDDASSLAAMGYLTLGRRFLGVTPDIIDDRIDVVTRGLMGLTVGCARCHDHKYDPIPTADYYSLYGVLQNCVERMVPVPRQTHVPPPTADYEKELLTRKQKLAEVTLAKRIEAGQRIRQKIEQYLLAQSELEKYPDLLFNQLLSADDLIPTIVHDWAAYLYRAKQANDPIFNPWFAFAELPDQDFASEAIDVAMRLNQAASTIHPRLIAAFRQPPASRAETAQRYQQVFTTIDSQWQTLCDTEKREGRPAPAAFPDSDDEALRQVLYGVKSPCVIPDEPIVSTEPYWDFSTIVELWKLQAEVDQWILQSPESAPHAVVLTDRAQTTEPRVFRRGNSTTPGEIVPRQFLKVLAGDGRQPFSHGSGRLELAQAIVDPRNPLTARVWVNRVWLHHFGSGLVNTPSDFGMRASAPSHPELLDWLATEFVNAHWSTKHLHRTIMLSATYQQGGDGSVDESVQNIAQENDPQNRLLSHMNERKLSFEQFRDTLATVSGELDPAMGGTAVDLFAASDLGFRRSIYGKIDRQYLPTVLRVFDFANPDMHSSQRAETIVPQQALFAMNHPFVADRARKIAKQVFGAEGRTSAEGVRRLYQTILQRDPSSVELAQAVEFVERVVPDPVPEPTPPASLDWAYCYGELEERSGRLKTFEPLPYFAGSAWQGSAQWPDNKLGWVQLTAQGGHPGNDLGHAAVRRWKAPIAGTIAVTSEFIHEPEAGDGVRYWVVSSRLGILKSGIVHKSRQRVDVESVEVQAGDTIDFVVDINQVLNSDQYLWAPDLKLVNAAGTKEWSANRDFPAGAGFTISRLTPWEQLAQLLLISNEVMFVD